MPYLLRKLPLHDRFSTVEVQGGRYRVCPFQILVWVSLGSMGSRELAPQALRFPAVLDTAFTDNFLIHRQQLRQWAGLQQEHLRRFGADLRAHGRQIPLYAANLWIHANVPGQRDRFADHTPFLTELHRGIDICEGADGYPRLPLLGARALRQRQLQLSIDYGRCQVWLRTPKRFWFFGW
jgi:hypothetical protein